jgi:hypothetical protein
MYPHEPGFLEHLGLTPYHTYVMSITVLFVRSQENILNSVIKTTNAYICYFEQFISAHGGI